MKHAIITEILAAYILLAGCSKAPTPMPVKDLVAQSQIITYTSADTNHAPHLGLVVTEILKGQHEALALGITNGMQFSYEYPRNVGHLPDGAFVFIQSGESFSTGLKNSSIYWVRGGRVKNMTIQQFKTTCGL
jgi:hypothetical protein